MKKSIWKSWIRSTAFLCMVVMLLEVILPAMDFISYNNVYADSTTETKWFPNTKPVRVKTDKITLDLSEYNLKERVIYKDKKLNDTGVKILYDDGSWLYLHEYINAGNDYKMGMMDDAEVLNATHIVGFEVAPGYEAVLRDGTNLENGEERKTRILGPLRMLGRSEEEYLSNGDYREKDGKRGSARDEDGKYEIEPSAFQSADKNKGGFKYMMASWEQFIRLWDYNWTNILSREHKSEEDIDKDVRNDVKMFNIKSVMVKRTTLKEGVYLMRGVCNVLNGETAKDMEESFSRGIFEYISPSVDEEDPEVMYYANETKTNGSVNGIMVVGNYEVNMERKRSKAILFDESKQATEYLVIKGSKNKAVVMTDAWKINYGFRGVENGEPSYSTSFFKGLGEATVSFLEEACPLYSIISGNIDTSSPVALFTDILIKGSVVGTVKGIFGFFKKMGETREVKPYYNDFVNLTITQRADDAEESNFDNCVYFKDEKREYAFTRRGASDRNKYDDLKGLKGVFQIKGYDACVKFCDVPKIEEEPAVTAYNKRNFKGEYFRFYRGETDNVGADKEIEAIKSLEIAPNTKVIFSDREDCYHKSEPNYGSIEKSSVTDTNALVVEGPAYISDLDKYLNNCCINNGSLDVNDMQLRSFRVQHVKNTGKGFSLYREKDGVGTFENIETVLDNFKSEINKAKINDKLESLRAELNEALSKIGSYLNSDNSNSKKGKTAKEIENDVVSFLGINSIDDIDAVGIENLVGKKLKVLDYYPQSISIRGNYFIKLYNKDGTLSRTVIGPAENYNLKLDEIEDKAKEFADFANEIELFGADKNDYYGVEFEKILPRDEDHDADDHAAGYDKLTTKALDYLKEFCEAHKGTSFDAMNDQNINRTPTEEESIRIISRDFLNFYKKKSKKFTCSDLLKRYKKDILGHLNGYKPYEDLMKKYIQDKFDLIMMLEEMKKYENDVKNMYTKWKDMTLVINELTQCDKKSRSLENVDGVILYQDNNYNEALGGAEDVWTRIPKSELIDVSSGESKGNFELSETSGFNMEVEYDNINSIKIAGTIAGSYQLIIKEKGGTEKKTRYSIPNLKEFFGKSDDDTLKIISIRLDKVAETKDLEILLDTSGKTNNQVKVKNFKIINTTETRVKKDVESTNGESDVLEREVYMISLFDVLDDINASMEYLYKYDVTGDTDDELVGAKIIRNIGEIGSSTPLKPGDNKETYKNIDKDVNEIVREIEIKFNKMSIEDIFRSLEFTVSNEYEYTDESRGIIITDHGYLDDEDEEIKVDNAVVTRYYRDVLEVPPMFVKEDYREVLENNQQVLENGKAKKIGYVRAVKEYELNGGIWAGKDEEDIEEDDKKFLYVPVCYKQDGKVFTGYLFEQLGIKASLDGNVIKLHC